MAIELSKLDRQQAITSIERYFDQQLAQRIGNIAAGGLLSYVLEEIGPSIYNQGVRDAQERMQARVADLDFEVHEAEFAYWAKFDRKARK